MIHEKTGRMPSRADKIVKRTAEINTERSGLAAVEAMKVVGIGTERIHFATSKVTTLSEKERSTDPDAAKRDDEDAKSLDNKRDALNQSGERAEKYLVEGFDALDPAEKKIVTDQIDAALPRLWPEMSKQLSDLKRSKPKEYKAFVESIAKDSKYALVVQEVLQEATNPDRKLPEIPLELRDKLTQVDTRLEAVRRDLDETQKTFDALNDRYMKEIGNPSDETTLDGQIAKLAATEDRDKAMLENTAHRDYLIRKLDKLEADQRQVFKKDSYTRDDAGLADQINNTRTELANAEKTINDAKENLSKLRALRQQKEELQKSLDTARIERNALEDEQRILIQQKKHVEDDIRLVELDRTKITEEYQNALDSAFQTATSRYFEGRFPEAQEAYDQAIAEAKEKAKSDAEKKVYDELLLRRWKNVRRGMFNREKVVPNRSQIDLDMRTLLSGADGPEKLLRKMGITDPDLQKEVQPKIIRALLQERLKNGGIKPGEAEYITSSRWGEGLLDEAIQKNIELKAQLENLKAHGVLRGTNWEAIKEFADKHPVLKTVLIATLIAGLSATIPISLFSGITGVRPLSGSLLGQFIGGGAESIPLPTPDLSGVSNLAGIVAKNASEAAANAGIPTNPGDIASGIKSGIESRIGN